LPPWAASPTGGERGSPSQFPRQLKKLEGISTEPIFSVTYPPRGRWHSSCLLESEATIFSEMDLIYQVKKWGI
jgi:hypothetical protein